MKSLEEPTITSLPNLPPLTASSYAERSAKSDRSNYDYQQDPSLYNLDPDNHQTLKLYEERLVTNKKRQQTGEVVLAKHVETETAKVSLPLEKDRIVIERSTPKNSKVTSVKDASFQEGEIVRMKVYEETADVHKEAFIREEVTIKKEVDVDTVKAQETLRREELDIDTRGRLDIDTQNS